MRMLTLIQRSTSSSSESALMSLGLLIDMGGPFAPVSHLSHGLVGRAWIGGPDLDCYSDAPLRRWTARITRNDPLATTDQKVRGSNPFGRTTKILSDLVFCF